MLLILNTFFLMDINEKEQKINLQLSAKPINARFMENMEPLYRQGDEINEARFMRRRRTGSILARAQRNRDNW